MLQQNGINADNFLAGKIRHVELFSAAMMRQQDCFTTVQ